MTRVVWLLMSIPRPIMWTGACFTSATLDCFTATALGENHPRVLAAHRPWGMTGFHLFVAKCAAAKELDPRSRS